jgi:hypothetical protein
MNRGAAVGQLAAIERAFTLTTVPTSLEETADLAVKCDFAEGL